MRIENQRMQDYLAAHGIDAMPWFIWKGTMKGCWRLYNHQQPWSIELAGRLMDLGFTGYDGGPLHQYSGNGGTFQTFVQGHCEFLDGVTAPRGATYRATR